ncbi:MAG: BMP family ABC transporter substrate-binding protein [Armatimonadetes bacterium]|nr:BMP family ABC transporter substrate-binding protein [Armatimonadota bacterium]
MRGMTRLGGGVACAVLAVTAVAAGCGGSEPSGGDPGAGTPPPGRAAPNPATSSTTPKSDLQVGLVTDVGGVGDLSFNMMANQGLELAQAELGVKPTLVESSQAADYSSNLERLVEKGCKLIFAVGFSLADAVKEVAGRHPDVHFAIIDSDGPAAPNVSNLVFREEEGSFLVGLLAGGTSRSGKVGFVGGMEIPLIKRFEAGFRAGVKTAKPAAVVSARYTNNWIDVAKGKELALSLFEEGADVVMHAAGQCGVGVIEAARQKGAGFWAIGVDADQDYLGTADPKAPKPPSRVLTSMMKRVDKAVFDTCKAEVEGKFVGGKRSFGVKEAGVGPSPLTYTKADLPAKLLQEVERLKQAVAKGELQLPTKVEEVAGWQAPTVTL